jgi:hypothetical protein
MTDNERLLFKHIGLYGLSVGTFTGKCPYFEITENIGVTFKNKFAHLVYFFICCHTADSNGIVWKSALLGNNDDVSISRNIPAKAIKRAQWTIFSRFGHIRIQTDPTASHGLHHEYRFDGFPPNEVDKIKSAFESLFNVQLENHAMSSAGTSYGKTSIKGRTLVFSHMVLEDADEEGEEFEARTGDEMMSMDLAEVSQCVLPGNNRNEIELQFPESDTLEAGTDQLGEWIHFAFLTSWLETNFT